MAHYEDLNTTKIALVGFISTVAVFAITLLMMVLFHWTMMEQDRIKVIDQPAAEIASLTADQQAQLASYRWIDREKKIVQIPIKQAMDLVLEELQKSPVPKDTPEKDKSGKDKTSEEKQSPKTSSSNSTSEKEGDHGS